MLLVTVGGEGVGTIDTDSETETDREGHTEIDERHGD